MFSFFINFDWLPEDVAEWSTMDWIVGIGGILTIVGIIVGALFWLFKPKQPIPENTTSLPPYETVPAILHEKTQEKLESATAELARLEEAERLRLEQNPDAALAERDARIKELEAQIGNANEKEARAEEAFKNGNIDIDEAKAQFETLAASKALDVEDAARYAYALGLIAEDEIRWADAAAHYARAANLDPNFDRLQKASEFHWRAGLNEDAFVFSRKIIAMAISEFGENSEQHAQALNQHALQLDAKGELDEAEVLYRETIKIGKATIEENHPNYATRLNNLANLLRTKNKLDEAETLYREALKIDIATIGKYHPDYAIHLNNLAGVLQNKGELDEAEKLYRQALGIFKNTLPPEHPHIQHVSKNLQYLHDQK